MSSNGLFYLGCKHKFSEITHEIQWLFSLRSTSIRHRSDTFASDWYLIHVDSIGTMHLSQVIVTHLEIGYRCNWYPIFKWVHYNDVIMSSLASQITSLKIVYSTVYTGALAFVRGIHRWPGNSPHKGPVKVENVSIWWRHHGSDIHNLLGTRKVPISRMTWLYPEILVGIRGTAQYLQLTTRD